MATGGTLIPPSQLPESLKTLSHFMKLAVEHDQRDPAISYYCRMYCVQKGMQIDRTSPPAKQFIVTLLDYLEKVKKQMQANEFISNSMVGYAHLEEYALKLFAFADKADRAGDFSNNVIKAFYSSGLLFDVFSQLQPDGVNEQVDKCRKYAKWKAIYIKNCQRNGIEPQPGPLGEAEGGEAFPDLSGISINLNAPSSSQSYSGSNTASANANLNPNQAGWNAPSQAQPPANQGNSAQFGYNAGYGYGQVPGQNPGYNTSWPQQPSSSFGPTNPNPTTNTNTRVPSSGTGYPSATNPSSVNQPSSNPVPPAGTSGAALGEWILRAQIEPAATLTAKEFATLTQYCKHANSALQFEDARTATQFFQKALYLISTGVVPK